MKKPMRLRPSTAISTALAVVPVELATLCNAAPRPPSGCAAPAYLCPIATRRQRGQAQGPESRGFDLLALLRGEGDEALARQIAVRAHRPLAQKLAHEGIDARHDRAMGVLHIDVEIARHRI